MISVAIFRFAVAAIAFVISTGGSAQAIPNCGPHAWMLKARELQYGEVPAARGTTNLGGLLEVLATPDGATWTILITGSNGVACMAATGQGWRRTAPRTAEQGT